MPGGTAIGVAAAVIAQGAAAVASQEAYASGRSVSLVSRGPRAPHSVHAGLTPLAWRVMIELEPFICERQLLDGNVIARGIEVGRLEFDRQRPLQHPSDREPPFAVMKFDPHILARRTPRALPHRLRPFFEGVVAGDAARDRHRFELRRAHDDALRIRIAAVANAHQFGELAKPAHAADPRNRLAIPHDAQRVARGADTIMPRHEARARLVRGKAADADDDGPAASWSRRRSARKTLPAACRPAARLAETGRAGNPQRSCGCAPTATGRSARTRSIAGRA